MKVGITLGEPAGIGPEVVRKALKSGKLPRGFQYEVIGSTTGVVPGKLTKHSATLTLTALEVAVKKWRNGEIAAVVTGPVQKEQLSRVGFAYPGQTEFFAARCGLPLNHPVMMLTDRRLTVSLLSTHCSLLEAIQQIKPSKMRQVIELTHEHLQRLNKRKPRLAVAGVNPHAGENGLFGKEEQTIFKPVIQEYQRKGILISGPHSPDTIFHRASHGEFDAVICSYHDQGLIPFKLLAFATGVNVTLGLPLIRTSPDHGTALDLAGKNQADPRSMIEAIKLACKLVRTKE